MGSKLAWQRTREAAKARASALRPERLREAKAKPKARPKPKRVCATIRRKIDVTALAPAARELREVVGSLVTSGLVPANLMGRLCHLICAAKHEAGPAVQDLALGGSWWEATGHGARTFRRRLGIAEKMRELYTAEVPLTMTDGTVQLAECPMQLPHEVLAADCEDGALRADYLVHTTDPKQVTPQLLQHPVTVSAASLEKVGVLTVFADGVGFRNSRESFVVYLLGSAYTSRRHVLAIVLKSQLCCCGCSGIHTFTAIEETLARSLCCAANGEHPTGRLDNRPWRLPGDAKRRALAERPAVARQLAGGLRFAVLDYRGDLKQQAEGLGLPHYARRDYPCFVCWCSRRRLCQVRRQAAWLRREDDEYAKAAEKQLIERNVCGPGELAAVERSLRFSKKRKGLAVRYPDAVTRRLGLLPRDRLERGEM